MPGEPIDNRSLLRRTLITMGAMVGGTVLLVGTLTLVASSVVGRAVASSAPDSIGTAPGPHAGSAAMKAPPPGVAKPR